MRMPIKRFWSMAKHVDRVRAERDLRALNIALCAACTAQGGDKDQTFLRDLRASLLEQVGMVSRQEEKVSSKAEIMALLNKQ